MLCLFTFRRLGVELGKSVVYQESNRGEFKIQTSIELYAAHVLNLCITPTYTKQLLQFCAAFTETRVDVKESVRGQTIFIIQTIPR